MCTSVCGCSTKRLGGRMNAPDAKKPRQTAAGRVRRSTPVAALVDTNVLVYRFDPRFPAKQKIATRVLREGIEQGSLRLPHQAIVEFVAVVTRMPKGGPPLLSPADACREAEELLNQFEVLYANDALLRTALR